MLFEKERTQLIHYGRKLVETGLTVGTFGNLSIFDPEQNLMAITPSGIDYADLEPDDIVIMTTEGETVEGRRKPSSEYDLHRIFYQKRPDVRAVVHTHSTYATVLACLHWEVEPIHYVIAYGGAKINCTPFVTMGTYALAEAAYAATGDDKNACLLGNHGLLAVGPNIGYAFDTAQQIEFVAQLNYLARVAGGGKMLDNKDLNEVLSVFKTYRQK